MSGNNDEITQALQKIASDSARQNIENSYNDPGSAMKEFGAPSNNMLLSSIHAESKRTSDQITKLTSRMARIESTLTSTQETMEKLCELMEVQNTLLSSQLIGSSNNEVTHEQTRVKKSNNGGTSPNWFYQGTKLGSKYKICTCLISQLIEIIRLRMESKSVFYPDSVDANFTVLEYCFRESSKVRCNIPSVKFKPDIDVPDPKLNMYEPLLPLISSKGKDEPTTLPETRLIEISSPLTRPVLEAVSRAIERMCFLEHILSPQQIDILRSIKSPIIIPGSDGELNWDESKIRPRPSHPMSNAVADLKPVGKFEYIKQIMKGQTPVQALATASASEQK